MDDNKSILKEVREAVGLASDTTDFDTDLLMHINGAIGKLNQNGIGKFLIVQNENTIWNDLIDPLQTDGNMYKAMIPLFITLSTKLLFDPPPPSSVQYHQQTIDNLLWRLKIAYEEYHTESTVEGGE